MVGLRVKGLGPSLSDLVSGIGTIHKQSGIGPSLPNVKPSKRFSETASLTIMAPWSRSTGTTDKSGRLPLDGGSIQFMGV